MINCCSIVQLSGRTFFEDDLLDAKKEEEEKQVEMVKLQIDHVRSFTNRP